MQNTRQQNNRHTQTRSDEVRPGGPLEWQEGVSGSSMDSQKAP